jgi:hypothetical protein
MHQDELDTLAADVAFRVEIVPLAASEDEVAAEEKLVDGQKL